MCDQLPVALARHEDPLATVLRFMGSRGTFTVEVMNAWRFRIGVVGLWSLARHVGRYLFNFRRNLSAN